LIATESTIIPSESKNTFAQDGLAEPIKTSPNGLTKVIRDILEQESG